jgi:formylglycine-generating enzyme required for sulfatase activity
MSAERKNVWAGWRDTAAGFAILLCVVDLSFVDLPAVAQEMEGQARWRIAAAATVLTVEQEKAKAAEPGSNFKECASGCPVMIVIPAGKFMMGSPENEPDRESSEGPQHDVRLEPQADIGKRRHTSLP